MTPAMTQALTQARRFLLAACAAILVIAPVYRLAAGSVYAAESQPISVDYPLSGSVFPPEMIPPVFLWHDASASADRWRIVVTFTDHSAPLRLESRGDLLKVGEIDPRCISPTNEPPRLTPALAGARTWTPDALTWATIRKHSVPGPATVVISGFKGSDPRTVLSTGQTVISTSKDPVGAPIFYRDVPLMPSETAKGVIKPLAESAVQLIQWRLRSIDQPRSRVVLEGMHTCANCHSFSRDGKTLGMDMDGPRNDKGLYALVPVKPQMTIRTEDMVNWNPSQERQFASNRVAFMSQVSPDGKFVLTMVTPADRAPENNYYVSNFKDYRFLQVFYPTRGILAWYDRATGERHPLPGADDPRFVQTDGVWSPDGKYVVFARAEARDPYPPDGKMAVRANDPNETKIQYDLYRVPFNDGRGGQAEPIPGASANGMSNTFPKVSPDGEWIVFVQCRNGQLMRPDSQLYIVSTHGGPARRMNANMSPMNSWHSWSPNGRWLVFSSKSRGPYTSMFLTHIDEQGNDTPAILIDNATAANRAVNIPEFVNIPANGMVNIATPAVDMYKQFDHATELGEKGQDAAAIAEWKALLAAHPDDARIRSSLGASLVRTGDYRGGVENYEHALQLNPQFNAVHGPLAVALIKTGRVDEALAQFRIALESAPASADLHNSYGSALARKGSLIEASDEFATAIKINPKLAEAHNNLGIALARQGRADEAQEHFARAIEINPGFAGAHNNLGIALLSGGDPAQAARAEQEFKAAIAINPRYADAEDNLGILYRQQGNQVDAERLFRQVLESEPRFLKALVHLSDVILSDALPGQSRFAEAGALIERALQIDPANPEAQGLRDRLKARANP